MTTATRAVAVVATRLPNIDRRALSQAWFSALHLTDSSAGGGVALHGAAPQASAGILARRAAGTPAPSANGSVSRQAAASARTVFAARPPMPERRAPVGELARRIERAIVRHAAVRSLHATTIAIKAGGGRVQLLVRTDGATTRIVALCAPHLRERVDRALAHARFALAASGMRLDVTQ